MTRMFVASHNTKRGAQQCTEQIFINEMIVFLPGLHMNPVNSTPPSVYVQLKYKLMTVIWHKYSVKTAYPKSFAHSNHSV